MNEENKENLSSNSPAPIVNKNHGNFKQFETVFKGRILPGLSKNIHRHIFEGIFPSLTFKSKPKDTDMVLDFDGNPIRPRYPRTIPNLEQDIGISHVQSVNGTDQIRKPLDPAHYDARAVQNYWQLEMTERAENRFKSDLKIYSDEVLRLMAEESKVLQFLLSHHNEDSTMAINAHSARKVFQPDEYGDAENFFSTSRIYHSTGNAATKAKRVLDLFNAKTINISTFSTQAAEFKNLGKQLETDLGETVDSYVDGKPKQTIMIPLDYLLSIAFVNALPQELFQIQLHDLWKTHPNGKINDFNKLVQDFEAAAHHLPCDAHISTADTGMALAATTAICSYCQSIQRSGVGHSSEQCFINPANSKRSFFNQVRHDRAVAFFKSQQKLGTISNKPSYLMKAGHTLTGKNPQLKVSKPQRDRALTAAADSKVKDDEDVLSLLLRAVKQTQIGSDQRNALALTAASFLSTQGQSCADKSAED